MWIVGSVTSCSTCGISTFSDLEKKLCWQTTCVAVLTILTPSRIACAKVITKAKCGEVEGMEIDGALSFRGIPYAAPPTGDLRWEQPDYVTPDHGNCWNGTYKATSFGSSCFQRDRFNTSAMTGSEDCLYLNVFTPTVYPKSRKPVMVWIHGGSLQFLNGNWPMSSPSEKLAHDTDVVYVSFNYRLHAFGFMALQILADNSSTGTSGNYGFMDMIVALVWVKENIKHFGGDPDQITVFGHSSGATGIFALLASPFTMGLFNKAWLSSGSAVLNKPAAEAYNDNLSFLKATNCSTVTCLRALTPEEVTSSVPWNIYPNWAMEDQGELPTRGMFDGAIAIVDGYILPWPPLEAWASGFAIDKTLLIGSCANEIDFNPTNKSLNKWSWTDYVNEVNRTLGTFGGYIAYTALQLYPPNTISPEYQYTSIASDVRANCPIDVIALTASQHFAHPVYRYVVTSQPSVPVNAYGIPYPASYSFHGWDMFAFFGTVSGYIANPTSEDLMFQTNVQQEVLSFVRNGRPKSDAWSTYPNTTAFLSAETFFSNAYHEPQCKFWRDNFFFDYAWIN